MQFVKTHARFLIVLVVLCVLLLVANGELKDHARRLDASRSAARKLLSDNYGALFRDARQFGGEPATVQGRKIQDRTQMMQQVEAGRIEMLAFETDPFYSLAGLPENAREDDHVFVYRSRVSSLQNKLRHQRYYMPGVDERNALGFDATREGVAAADVPDNLRKLDIVNTVADCVSRSGVARLERLNFREVTSELSARGVAVQPMTEGEPPYLAGQGLEIEVRASERALYNLLADLQRPVKGALRARCLSVERFDFAKPDLLDPADDLIHAKLTVVAWQVNEQSSYPQDRSGPEQTQTSTRAPRSFR